MSYQWRHGSGDHGGDGGSPGIAPGKRAPTDSLRKKASSDPTLRKNSGPGAGNDEATARAGFGGTPSAYPHRDTIERSFGMSLPATSYADEIAGTSSAALGADGYALGNQVAFASPNPSLFVAAHEAAHVMQSTSGVHLAGGDHGDPYEAHADAVAGKVVAGESALDFLIGGPAAGPAVRKHDGDGPKPPAADAGQKQTPAEAEADAKAIHTAVAGFGTDEEELVKRLEYRTPAEVTAIRAIYLKLFGETLDAAIRGDVSTREADRMVGGFDSGSGKFVFDQYDVFDGDPGKDSKKSAGIDIKITFMPAQSVKSDQISFVQIMKADKGATPLLFDNEKPRATTAGDGEAGWAVDRLDQNKNADYQIGNDGKEVPGWGQIGHRKSKTDVRDATLLDGIRLPRDAGQTFKVQATSFALDKTNSKYLGGVAWGYDVDAAGKVVKTPASLKSAGDPSGIQKKALERWNDQAKNPDVTKRNHADQKPITVP